MLAPPTPSDETRRLETLRGLKLLDTLPEERFDRVTRLAKQIFSTPIALVSLVDADRQWFKSVQGLDVSETPRNVSFCGHAILDDKIMIVNDASEDQRFCDNPLVCHDPNIRFYAGYPLSAPDGSRVGTLCVIDREPKEITDEQAQLLRELGRMVEEELIDADVATVDPITSLSNRNGFLMIAEHLLSMCVRTEQPATMLLFHFQNLQSIDDTLGRDSGDAAAVEFAHQLASTFRNSDIVARISSDFFCVLLAGTNLEDVDHVRRRFNEEIGDYNRDEDSRHEYSIGIDAIAFKPERHGNAKGLLKEAERRIYNPQETAA
ncbi:MAG: sensor domain-containing diguanylate cyclase [Gammaproteobacteria bacterium]|nr:sensor domain-containing diguanylate cyclase [Gammaproteobacteria bacterium]MBU2676247.1 sensor domain-containing diguanylate cyclase [Gammaproteobacteria bacterium]NNC56645.1 sensor domain-containing diguanylate cyclase [Woeseiaceae bacterium]NNL49982.1 sensor domain-containing diguanylate cyclase [Woeseiaceae bacterium]